MAKISKINDNEIKRLINESKNKNPKITIYLPINTTLTSEHISADYIRIKNIKNEVIKKLQINHQDTDFIQEFSQKIDEIMSDILSFHDLPQGLLMCISPGVAEIFRLPIETKEYVVIDEQFYLAPILGLISDYQDFYLLVLSLHDPKLYKGDAYGLYPTSLKFDRSPDELLNIDEINTENVQAKSANGGGSGGYNGRGGEKDQANSDRQKFWRMIDRRIIKSDEQKLPLILAGVESEIAEFVSISSYPNILSSHLEGSYRTFKPNDLFPQVEQIIRQEIIEPEHQKIIAEYNRLSIKRSDLIVDNTQDITKASDQGMVDKLILAGLRFTADTIKEKSKPEYVLSFPSPSIAKKINLAALNAWHASAKVINLDMNQMPKIKTNMLAILRYSGGLSPSSY